MREIFAKILRFEPNVTSAGLIANKHTRLVAYVFGTNVFIRFFRTFNSGNVDTAFVGKCAAADEGGALVGYEIRDFINVAARMCEHVETPVGQAAVIHLQLKV